ncbi:hypothetical protein THOM_0360 [Trachipleistophora hominis]|uniref:Uncharacterized protein n=1 Tax=Trachipleistophora hominis TaxID=72359 RepID=L7K011_TRAHO|nr:hypothetical protein THOM_0360 [Trachipleistophora hominis]
MLDVNDKTCWKCSTGMDENYVVSNLIDNTPLSSLSCVGCTANEFLIKERLNTGNNKGIEIRCDIRSINDLNNFVFLNSDSVVKITKNRFTYHYSKSETVYTTTGNLLKKIIRDLQYYLDIEIKNNDLDVKEKLWNHLYDDKKVYDDALLAYEDSSYENGDIYFCNDEMSNVNSTYSSSFFEGMERNEVAKFNHHNLDLVIKDKSCDLLIVDLEGVSRVFDNVGFSNGESYDDIDILNHKRVHHKWLK